MNNTLRYIGKVRLDTMKRGRRVSTSIHNTGLPDMSWMFAKALTGNLNQSMDVPRLIDLGYIIPGTGIWTSILNTPVNIGGRQYSFDVGENNWIGTLVATIYYSDINGGIIDSVIERANDPDSGVQLKLRLCSYQPENRKYFAEVNITPAEVTRIKELTSVIITWYSEIIPDVSADAANAGDIQETTEEQSTGDLNDGDNGTN